MLTPVRSKIASMKWLSGPVWPSAGGPPRGTGAGEDTRSSPNFSGFQNTRR